MIDRVVSGPTRLACAGSGPPADRPDSPCPPRRASRLRGLTTHKPPKAVTLQNNVQPELTSHRQVLHRPLAARPRPRTYTLANRLALDHRHAPCQRSTHRRRVRPNRSTSHARKAIRIALASLSLFAITEQHDQREQKEEAGGGRGRILCGGWGRGALSQSRSTLQQQRRSCLTQTKKEEGLGRKQWLALLRQPLPPVDSVRGWFSTARGRPRVSVRHSRHLNTPQQRPTAGVSELLVFKIKATIYLHTFRLVGVSGGPRASLGRRKESRRPGGAAGRGSARAGLTKP